MNKHLIDSADHLISFAKKMYEVHYEHHMLC